MKKLLFSVFFILIFTAPFSCSSPDPNIQAQDALRDEVFAIHDEVMPKMADLNRLKARLLEVKTGTLKLDSLAETQVDAVIFQLEKADEGMMGWMNNFKSPEKLRDTQLPEEILRYLAEEKAKISKVREDMLNSISAAEQLLAGKKAQ